MPAVTAPVPTAVVAAGPQGSMWRVWVLHGLWCGTLRWCGLAGGSSHGNGWLSPSAVPRCLPHRRANTHVRTWLSWSLRLPCCEHYCSFVAVGFRSPGEVPCMAGGGVVDANCRSQHPAPPPPPPPRPRRPRITTVGMLQLSIQHNTLQKCVELGYAL
jgi:hypothetical protein